MEMINALGRRKAAVARVYVQEGTGKITINGRDLDVYFPSPILQYVVKQPLNKLEVAEKYDIKVNLDGGGYKGQAEALRLAIARALVKINPEDKPALKAEGFMTRDAREVERKKPGQPKARKHFQFSKRIRHPPETSLVAREKSVRLNPSPKSVFSMSASRVSPPKIW